MRGLFGDFATMPLKELVVYLGNRKATGTLSLEHDVVRKQVLLHHGFVVNASSNEPREYLGQFLINLGHITEEQFHQAYETQKETKVFLGRILVMTGVVTQATLENALSLKLRETLLDAFQWPEGSFAFDSDKVPQSSPDSSVEMKIDLLDIAHESDVRQTVWHAVRNVFSSGNLRLKLHRHNLAEEPRPGSLDDRMLKMIEAGQTIDELALSLHATKFFLYQRLIALHHLEAVSIDRGPSFALSLDDATERLSEQDGPGFDQLLSNARAFYGQGNLRDAVALARRANQLKPSAEASALLQDLENRWVAKLRVELLGRRNVPKLKIKPESLKQQNLSAPERYLLSRVDGKRTLFQIISVSPLRELDALAHFARFVEKKLVALSE